MRTEQLRADFFQAREERENSNVDEKLIYWIMLHTDKENIPVLNE